MWRSKKLATGEMSKTQLQGKKPKPSRKWCNYLYRVKHWGFWLIVCLVVDQVRLLRRGWLCDAVAVKRHCIAFTSNVITNTEMVRIFTADKSKICTIGVK